MPYKLRGVNLLFFFVIIFPLEYARCNLTIMRNILPFSQNPACTFAKWLFTKLEENIIKKYEEDDYLLKLWSRVCECIILQNKGPKCVFAIVEYKNLTKL